MVNTTCTTATTLQYCRIVVQSTIYNVVLAFVRTLCTTYNVVLDQSNTTLQSCTCIADCTRLFSCSFLILFFFLIMVFVLDFYLRSSQVIISCRGVGVYRLCPKFMKIFFKTIYRDNREKSENHIDISKSAISNHDNRLFQYHRHL